MNVTINAVNFEAKDSLKEYIEEKLTKLTQYYDKIVYAKISLKLDNVSSKDNKIVEILLGVPGDDIFVKNTEEKFEKALDSSLETASRLLKRKREKETTHNR